PLPVLHSFPTRRSSDLWLRRAGLSRPVLVRFALATAVAAVALVVMLVATPLGGRLLDIGRGIGLRDRVLLYQSAFQMFLDHPFVDRKSTRLNSSHQIIS